MLRVAFAELAWIEMPMPDGSGPIALARLPRLPDGHLRLFGRFPHGWVRAVPGHYPAFEEILLLEGDLTVGSATCGPGGWLRVPARGLRARTASDGGCLAFARFGGSGRWTLGEATTPPDAPTVAHADVRGRAVLLDARGGETSRTVLDAAEVPAQSGLVEWLSLVDHTWCCTEPGEPAPSLDGPLFVRTLPAPRLA